MRILAVEDDPAVSRSLALMLRSDTCIVDTADLGEEGIELAKVNTYDLILLDLNLPDLSGYEVLRALRVARVNTPVVILSGLGATADKVRGLAYGADDYLTKPFHKDELLARVQAVVRRSQGPTEEVVRCGDLVVWLDAQRAEIAGQPVPLTVKEYQMLELLALRKGMTVSKDMFLSHFYSGRDEPGLKIIDVFMCKLRKKLAEMSGGIDYVETVWGRGYMLREPHSLQLRHYSGVRLTGRIAGFFEEVPAFVGAEQGADVAQGGPERLERARRRLAQERFDLGERHLDGVQIRRVLREEQEPGAARLERRCGAGALVDREIVRDHDVAGPKGRGELGLDIGVECRAVHGAIHHPRGGEPITPERSDVWVPQRPNGAEARKRCPRRLRPRSRVIFVLTAVSSMNTRRAG